MKQAISKGKSTKNGKNKTALCLNSAFFGFYAHAGFVQGLKQVGFQPDVITGCSAGAMIGAVYSAGVDMDRFVGTLENLRKDDFWEGNFFSHIIKPFRLGLRNYSGLL